MERLMASSSRAGNPPTRSTLSAIIRRRRDCPICLAAVEPAGRGAALLSPCLHLYCLPCIRTWTLIKPCCPLCNQPSLGWYARVGRRFDLFPLPSSSSSSASSSSSSTSSEQANRPRSAPIGPSTRRHRMLVSDRFLARSRENVNWRSRPLPWCRSFSRQSFLPPTSSTSGNHLVDERVVSWRASIYKRQLLAVPVQSVKINLNQVVGCNDGKARLRQRIEPWILRELHAILGDLDLAIIVHLAMSLLIFYLEKKLKNAPSTDLEEDEYRQQLRPFLGSHTSTFWHELRCFGESSLTLEAYDCVVEYKPSVVV